MKKCVECDSPAEHMHHVVPKSKGGTFTIPLCATCHSNIHDMGISTSYLTRFGLLKSEKELYCRIFYLITVEKLSKKAIIEDVLSINDTYTEDYILRRIERLKLYRIQDLLSLFEPILQYNSCQLYNKYYYKMQWAFFLKNGFQFCENIKNVNKNHTSQLSLF